MLSRVCRVQLLLIEKYDSVAIVHERGGFMKSAQRIGIMGIVWHGERGEYAATELLQHAYASVPVDASVLGYWEVLEFVGERPSDVPPAAIHVYRADCGHAVFYFTSVHYACRAFDETRDIAQIPALDGYVSQKQTEKSRPWFYCQHVTVVKIPPQTKYREPDFVLCAWAGICLPVYRGDTGDFYHASALVALGILKERGREKAYRWWIASSKNYFEPEDVISFPKSVCSLRE